MPDYSPDALFGRRVCHGECNGEILLIKSAFSGICQHDVGSADCHLLAGTLHSILWHGHFPVHHTEGGPVLEFPVFSPFHADETAAENREPGIARKHDCLRVSHRVILCRRVVPEFLCTEQSAQKRCVGGDAVNPECNHCLDVSFLVDCPYIDAHPEGLGFLHPFRMGIEDLVMIVNSVDAVLVKICRGDVAVQILVG